MTARAACYILSKRQPRGRREKRFHCDALLRVAQLTFADFVCRNHHEKSIDDTQLAKMADTVDRPAKRLARFLCDLPGAPNSARGGVALCLKRASLSEVMQAAVDFLMALAEPWNQTLSIEPWPETALSCDAGRISHALGDVMANASEFTGGDGRILARTHVDAAIIRIDVKDNGIGIHPEYMGKIFKPYTHFATHTDRKRAGAG